MFRSLKRVAAALRRQPATTQILDVYVKEAPSPQHALDIHHGEWASRFPAPLSGLRAGQALLFEDGRLSWGLKALGGVEGRRVLELGPLEGGHSYLCDRAGAREVIAIEANTRAYSKCLIAKELLGMPSVRFLCGDFVEYLRHTTERFDLCVAAGVLYHMKNPVEVLALVARVAPRVYIWTHYYDGTVLGASARLSRRIVAPTMSTVEGYAHQLYRHQYGAALDSAGFCGGGAEYSHWLTREGLLGALAHLGYRQVEVAFEEPAHVNGPALSLVASR